MLSEPTEPVAEMYDMQRSLLALKLLETAILILVYSDPETLLLKNN